MAHTGDSEVLAALDARVHAVEKTQEKHETRIRSVELDFARLAGKLSAWAAIGAAATIFAGHMIDKLWK